MICYLFRAVPYLRLITLPLSKRIASLTGDYCCLPCNSAIYLPRTHSFIELKGKFDDNHEKVPQIFYFGGRIITEIFLIKK